MSTVLDPRSDAVTELIRILREQASAHAQRISELERQLYAANQRIAEQQRLLGRVLERGIGGQPPSPLPAPLVYPAGTGYSSAILPSTAAPPGIAARQLAPVSIPAAPQLQPQNYGSGIDATAVVHAGGERVEPTEDIVQPVSKPPAGGKARRISLPKPAHGAAHIEMIAAVVLTAGSSPQAENTKPRPAAPGPSLIAVAPTRGVVRAPSPATVSAMDLQLGTVSTVGTVGTVGSLDSSSVVGRETTLRMDKNSLRRGHQTLKADKLDAEKVDGRRRWFRIRRTTH